MLDYDTLMKQALRVIALHRETHAPKGILSIKQFCDQKGVDNFNPRGVGKRPESLC